MKQVSVKICLMKIVFIIGIFLSGVGLGTYGMQKYTSAQVSINEVIEAEKAKGLITDKIAIVNLDKGVMVDDKNINYAGKLLVDLEENILFTGLEDARTGYDTGIYAGYLVIPATFSQNVVSLNETPVRAEITYAINDNLIEETKEKVIYDILGLASELNDSISYMYLHSVMEEFHDAQNEADTVMKNDLEEKEAINAIKANDFVALVPVTEITEIENSIVPVDISQYMAKNAELTGEVGTKYHEYLMESEIDHQKLNEEAMELMAEMGNMDSIIGGIDLYHDAEGNSIYLKGTQELETLFEGHNATLFEKEEELQENVLKIYSDIQNYLSEYERTKEAYETENEQRYINTLTALERLFEEYKSRYVVITGEELAQLETEIATQNEQIATQQAQIEELKNTTDSEEVSEILKNEGIQEIATVDMPETEEVELSDLQKEMQTILADNYYVFEGYLLDQEGKVQKDEEGNSVPLTSLFNEYNKDLTDERVKVEILDKQVGEIERIDIDEVTEIADEEILMPIQENVNSVTEAILNQYAIEKEQLGEYRDAVMGYSPLKYIDYEEIQRLTGAMFDNGTNLSKAIIETDIQQMEYVADVYEATRKDLADMQDSIFRAKEDSDRAVAEGIASLQDIKNSNSDENQRIMYDFSEKLPYTRLGSLEYTQAYEFMTDPIDVRKMDELDNKISSQKTDSVKMESDSVSVKEKQERDNQMIVLMICAMICVIIVSTTIKYHFHKKEEGFFKV